MPDTKDFRTIDEQIEGLEKRGLQFKNKKKAVDILKKYNYFDVINGFESILLKRNVGVKEYENIYFEDFKDLMQGYIIFQRSQCFVQAPLCQLMKLSEKSICQTGETAVVMLGEFYLQTSSV